MILITRDEEGNRKLAEKLEELGLKVKSLSSIKILPPSNVEALDNALNEISGFNWIVFTSANGVRAFFGRIRETGKPSTIIEELVRNQMTRLACVGPSTAEALGNYGLSSNFMPRKFLTEKLGEELSSQYDLRSKKILLVRVESGANERLAQILKDAGAEVRIVGAYRTEPNDEKLPSSFLDDVTDIAFTSPSSVKATVAMVGSDAILGHRVKVHCIGPVTAGKALDLGLRVATVASPHTIAGLVSAIIHSKDST